MKTPIEDKTYVYVTSPEHRKYIESMAEKSGFKKQEGYTGKGDYISFWGDRVFTDSADLLERLSIFKQVFIDMPPINPLVDNFIENTSEAKNPIAPNTKIRILSPEHANYVQRLSKDAGFKPFLTDMSINLPWVAFHYDMDFTCNKSIGAYGELKEIFIDLPTELMTAEYIKKFNGGADVDLSEDDVDFIKDVLSGVGEDLEKIINKSDTQKSCNDLDQDKNPSKPKHSHYFKDVSDLDEVDVYRVCDLFEVNDNSGAIQHALKKLLCSGQRGAKGYRKDLEEARDSIQRKLYLMAEDGE